MVYSPHLCQHDLITCVSCPKAYVADCSGLSLHPMISWVVVLTLHYSSNYVSTFSVAITGGIHQSVLRFINRFFLSPRTAVRHTAHSSSAEGSCTHRQCCALCIRQGWVELAARCLGVARGQFSSLSGSLQGRLQLMKRILQCTQPRGSRWPGLEDYPRSVSACMTPHWRRTRAESGWRCK